MKQGWDGGGDSVGVGVALASGVLCCAVRELIFFKMHILHSRVML
jgi:hypothetical protein